MMMERRDASCHTLAAETGGPTAQGQKAAFILSEHHGAMDDVINVPKGKVTEHVRQSGAVPEGCARTFLAVGEAGHRLHRKWQMCSCLSQRVDQSDPGPRVILGPCTAVCAHEDRYIGFNVRLIVDQCRVPTQLNVGRGGRLALTDLPS